MFHVSLLKPFRQGTFEPARADSDTEEEEDDEFPPMDPEAEDDPEIDRIVRWRKIRVRNKVQLQYLIIWVNKPLEEATWRNKEDFDQQELLELLEDGQPSKDPGSLCLRFWLAPMIGPGVLM